MKYVSSFRWWLGAERISEWMLVVGFFTQIKLCDYGQIELKFIIQFNQLKIVQK